MKKIIVIAVIGILFFSCKNNEGSNETATENQNMPVYKGEFIFTDNAAVLKGSNFIYGVKIDDMAKELAKKVAPVKRDEFDMVPVIVKGTVAKKEEGQEGWDEILTISEIVSVSDTPSEADIKIEEKKE
jgi:hypothetical protein